jgi:hypothetical protein
MAKRKTVNSPIGCFKPKKAGNTGVGQNDPHTKFLANARRFHEEIRSAALRGDPSAIKFLESAGRPLTSKQLGIEPLAKALRLEESRKHRRRGRGLA